MNLQRSLVGFAGLILIGMGSCLAANQNVSVGGTGLVFSPANVTINVGDTVTFTYAGGPAHNAVADDGSFRCAKGCDHDNNGGNGNLATNWSAIVTFDHAGTFPYYCEAHGGPGGIGMHGSIKVNAVVPPTFNIVPGLSGNWDDPTLGQDGHGFQFEILPGNVFLAIWFVYPPSGVGQTWLYAQGSYVPPTNTLTIDTRITTGPKFPPAYLASDKNTTIWGTLTFTFTDCNNGTATWATTAAGFPPTGTFPISRVTSIAGLSCP